MRRREFITLLGSAAVGFPLAARAQQVGKVPRIGYLSPGSASPGPLAYHDEFQRGLRELGYVEGRNIVIEYRFADGKFDRLAALAAELVQLNVDVIVSVPVAIGCLADLSGNLRKAVGGIWLAAQVIRLSPSTFCPFGWF